MLKTIALRISHLSLQFIAGLVLSNILLPESFGRLSLVILNAALFNLITGLGTDALATNRLSRQSWSVYQAIRFLAWSLVIQVALFLILQFVWMTVWSKTLLAWGDVRSWWMEGLYFLGLALIEKTMSVLYPLHKDRIFNKSLVLVSLSFLVLIMVARMMDWRDARGLFLLFASQTLLQGVAGLFLVLKTSRSRELIKPAVIDPLGYWQHLRISSVVMITNIVQLVAYRIDFWLLKSYHGTDAVGIYAQANKFANLSWLLPSMLAQLLIPRFRAIPNWGRQAIFGTALVLNLALALGSMITGYIIFHYFLNPSYASGWEAQWRMMPGYYAWSFVIFAAAFVSYETKFVYNLFCSFLCLALVLSADLLLIPSYGIRGAAWANTIGYSCVAVVYLVMLRKRFQIDALSGLRLIRTSLSQTLIFFK